MGSAPHDEALSAGARTAALDVVLQALRGRGSFDDVDEALAWAALDAAGVQGGWREAVRQAGGPRAVLGRGALSSFASPVRRTRVLSPNDVATRLQALRPWLREGGRVVVGDELQRFERQPACCLYGFGEGRVPPPRASSMGARGVAGAVVALVGSRRPDLAWCQRAERVAAACARAGVVVVSGGAPGIDRAAQRAAREAGGGVIVVQGTTARPPVDVAVDAGLCWLSPYGPWRAGARHLFAERNAWIAACADVVVVVCGAARSGTRHTVDAALRFRRPVVTLAADDACPLGAIPRRLAALGAPVVDDEDVDVAALLAAPWWGDGLSLPGFAAVDDGAPAAPIAGAAPRTADAARAGADADASPLLQLLARHGPLLLDDAAARLCTPVRALLAEVALLELEGIVRREGALLHGASGR